MKYFKIIILSIGLVAVNCSTQNIGTKSTKKIYDSKHEEALLNVKYGLYKRNVMDVYLPANRSIQTAFLISIHGGAWTTGDKRQLTELSKYLLSQGIAVANLNYRYANSTDTHLPELLDDIENVVKYLASHSKEWNIRNEGFSILGGSSGAHVSMMYAYTRNPQIKSIVDICGPTDFTNIQTLEKIRANLFGGLLFKTLNKMSENKVVWKPGNEIPEAYIMSSPAKFVRQIPIMIVHGDKDNIVPIEQAYTLENELKTINVQNKLIVVSGARHNPLKRTKDKQSIFADIVRWLKEYGVN
ncbi:alpha/beta hydrolase family protein [Elizabethkingia sp. YR214]|nr:alpha/beta hydrolase family protein [Elizabethkingia sp. YR214]